MATYTTTNATCIKSVIHPVMWPLPKFGEVTIGYTATITYLTKEGNKDGVYLNLCRNLNVLELKINKVIKEIESGSFTAGPRVQFQSPSDPPKIRMRFYK